MNECVVFFTNIRYKVHCVPKNVHNPVYENVKECVKVHAICLVHVNSLKVSVKSILVSAYTAFKFLQAQYVHIVYLWNHISMYGSAHGTSPPFL